MLSALSGRPILTPRVGVSRVQPRHHHIAKAVSAPEKPQEVTSPSREPLQRSTSGGMSSGDGKPTAAAVDSSLTNEICTEHVEEVALKLSGEFPEWLLGVLIRNGPGTFKGMKHLFDGYGMLAKFRFEGGRVWAQNRYVQSGAWKAFRAAGDKQQFSEFGTPAPLVKNLWNTLKHYSGLGQGFTDNSNVHVLPVPGTSSAVSMSEPVASAFSVSLDTLETQHQMSFKDELPGLLTSAHPGLLRDGSIVNYTSQPGGSYTVFRSQPGSDVRKKIAEIPLRGATPAWIHDFPVTENYVIIPETPAYFSLKALATGKPTDYVVIDWQPQQETLLHVIPLAGGPVRTVRCDCYFTFHYLNAYETDDGHIHADFSHFEDPSMLNNLYLTSMREGVTPIRKAPLRRLRIPLEGDGQATIQKLMTNDDDYIQAELPRVNPHYRTRPYRFGYSVSAKGSSCTFANALARYDLQTGATSVWHEEGTIPTEPIMVPRQGAGSDAAEDDGVVLSVVTGADGVPFLLALDAHSFKEVGRAHLPAGMNLPYSFHGAFVPA